MNIKEDIDVTSKENVINFEEAKSALKTKGNEPVDPNDPNWLSQLDVGTVFLVQDKSNPANFVLGEFLLKDKTAKSALLLQVVNDTHVEVAVNPLRFCRKFDLYEILLTAEERNLIVSKNLELKDSSKDTSIDLD